LELELREHDVHRLEQRTAYLEAELKLQAQHHTNSLKDLIMLRRQLRRRQPSGARAGGRLDGMYSVFPLPAWIQL
jgi:hypothetical protein